MDLVPGLDRDRWHELALASQNIFSTPEWLETWWKHYGTGSIVSVHDDDVVLPLHRTGGLVGQLRFIGSEQSDQLGPICAPEHRPRAVEMIREVVAREKVDVLLLQDVPTDDDWWSPLGGQEIRVTAAPVVLLHTELNDPGEAEVQDGDPRWERYVASRSKNMRSQLRKKPSRLPDSFDEVEYRVADADTLRTDLDRLFDLHEDRWDGDTPLASDRLQRFLHEFAAVALDLGWLRLTSLALDGTVRAAQLDLWFGDHAGCYQVGRDPSFDDHSLGYVLMAHCIEQAAIAGRNEYRFLRGNESYKYRFATHSGDVHTIAVPMTLKGRAAVKVATMRDEPDDSPPEELPPRPRGS